MFTRARMYMRACEHASVSLRVLFASSRMCGRVVARVCMHVYVWGARVYVRAFTRE